MAANAPSNPPAKKAPAKKTGRGRIAAATRAAAAEAGIEADGDLDDFLPAPAIPPGVGAEGDDGPMGEPEMDGFPQSNRRADELHAQMAARMKGEPVFPYPAELPKEHQPYWLELVNSFPKDHFQVSDITLMKLYCRCAYDIERTTAKIEEEGEVVMGGRGPMVNPRVKVRGDCVNTLMSIATKFRNQPASRVNTENFGTRQEKAQKAAGAASSIHEDDDGLLAGGTRH
jgi:phage terminase small subunit